MSEITYDDKIDLNVESTIANINKVTASDMNEIKSVVNANANTLDEINVPSNWIEVGTTAPTDKKVWFKANKNIFDLTTAYHGIINGSGVVGPNESFRTTQYIPTSPATKYYFSTTQISGQTNKQIYIAYYDSSKTFVSRTSYNLLESAFTTPSNCYYMRAGVYSQCQENIMLELGNTKSTYVPFGNQDLIVNGGKFIADQLISVGATNPNDGRRVWFGKSKNLLPYTGFITQTINGITITNNNNGTFTINGTATGDISYPVYDTFIPMSGTWRLVGCPSGGSSTTYMLSAYVGYWGGSAPNIDTGSGTNITYTGNVKIRFYIKSGTTCNNLIFKPMLTYNTSATYETFEPYVDQGIYVDNEQMHFDNYSTNEQVIGKWIDGKNIYRKTYKVTNISSSNVDLVDVSGLNFDTIIKLYGFVRSQVGMCMPMPLTDSASNYNVLFLSVNKIRGRVVFDTGGSVKDCFVTIEYTKT